MFCCYCVFLQSSLGLHISRLLGIKTADYEYNPKKDDLKTTLESYRCSINIFFWLNFFLFYVAVIFLPINFVLKCSGHQWTGHIIYASYALLVGIIEVVLALYCIKFGITHQEYIKGPFYRRLFFFVKDMLLSQLARFDVYSDICFITTVMTCGTTQFVGYLAIAVMGINLFATAYHVLKLLLSKFGGDENYIDYLCNYCAFLEINVVSLLLEKWTIQNTSSFLCFKGLPNRVYAACFRTFFEDMPQFFL